MKKGVILIAGLAIAFAARADIVNGSFSQGKVSSIVNLKSPSLINKGWYDSNITETHFKFINGGITLNGADAAGKPAIIGQLFTCKEDGDRSLNVDVTILDAGANAGFQIQLYGYTQLTAQKTILFANAIKLGDTSPPSNSEYYTVTKLVNTARAQTDSKGAVTTKQITFTASTAYAFYGIRIIANCPDETDEITFDNISITPVPEPEADVAK